MTVLNYVRLIAKEFNDVTDADINEWIVFLAPFVSKKLFGNLYERALALLVCHKLKMAGQGESPLGEMGSVSNAIGGISSISDGGSSISFANNGASNLQQDAEYALTAYGIQYLQLRRSVIIPIRMSGENA